MKKAKAAKAMPGLLVGKKLPKNIVLYRHRSGKRGKPRV